MISYKPRTQCGGKCSTARTGGVCTCIHPVDLARRGRRGPADKAVTR